MIDRRPLSATRSLKGRINLMFMLLGVILLGLLVGYWIIGLEPRLRAEAQANASAVAYTQAQFLAETLTPIGEWVDPEWFNRAIDHILLLTDPNTGQPFVLGLEVEIDYDAANIQQGGLKLKRGNADCRNCFLTEIPLYSGTTRELLGIARFYSGEHFFQRLKQDVRDNMKVIIGLVLVLLSLAWWTVSILLKPLGKLADTLRSKDIDQMVPLDKLDSGGSEEIRMVKDAIDDLFKRIRMHTYALRNSEARFHAIFDHAMDGILLTDMADLHFLDGNATICRMLGYKHEELTKLRVMDIHPEEGLPHVLAQFDKQVRGEIMLAEDLPVLKKDGSIFFADISAAPFNLGEGTYLLGLFRDITDRKQAEVAIREEEQKVRDLLNSTAEAIYGLDLQGNCTFANRACVQMLGYQDTAELIGRNMHDLIHHSRSDSTTYPVEESHIFQTLRCGNGSHIDTEVLWRADGSSFPAEYWSYPICRDGKRAGAVVTFLDITERKQQAAHILRQAHFDGLTNLPNRFLTLDRMSQLMNEASRNKERVALLFLDLDDFKKINDTLGHETGDKLLIEAASRLRSVVRSGDTVGRLGGDEFIVLLGRLLDATNARPVVENLLDRFRETFSIDDRELVLTASVGIALYPDDGDTPSVLLRNADSAMFHAKAQGRNTYSYFTDAMNREVSRRLVLEELMHGALDRGEFRLCYQPQVELSSGGIIGTEALLRWHNPVLGEVSPMEFIPIAEQTGLIMPIGEFVLTEALGMAARWQEKHGQPLTMAVNLSPRQFRDPNLVAFIEEAICQSGTSGESLELEITEGVLLSGNANIDDALSALNTLGVGIAMDDFGTGYSSLSYLRSYPFDCMKIDRSFVNDITVDAADMELVSAAIAMAHTLGMKVIAEGVETEEQRSLLAAQGCEFAQGYLFSKPVSPEEMTEMLESVPPRSAASSKSNLSRI